MDFGNAITFYGNFLIFFGKPIDRTEISVYNIITTGKHPRKNKGEAEMENETKKLNSNQQESDGGIVFIDRSTISMYPFFLMDRMIDSIMNEIDN